MATATPTLGNLVTTLTNALTPYLPAAVNGVPAPSVAVTNFRERSAGLGRRLGENSVAGFGVISLKGLRLEGSVRFQIWAAAPNDVDTAIATLNSKLLADRDQLWKLGFLKFTMANAKPATNAQSTLWRRYADYRFLFEFPFDDTDDSDGLIARIPITIDSAFNESTTVTDHLARWDNLSAAALKVRGNFGLGALASLDFLPPPRPTGSVTITRTFDGASGAPTAHGTLHDFLAAVSGDSPTETNSSLTFASVAAFLAALPTAGTPIALGDFNGDGIPDQYQPRSLTFDAPIHLKSSADRFEIAYQNAVFDQVGVVYVRLGASVQR
jgi:hypothetical protein